MGFTYAYKDLATHWYRGYYIRRTWSSHNGKFIYQINDEPIDAPLSKRELTTMKKVHEYIDKRIEDRTGIKVIIAEDPKSCVAIGTGKALDQLESLKTNYLNKRAPYL